MTVRAFAVDAVGNAYIAATITGSAWVLERWLDASEGSALVARVTRDGTGWVQRYGSLTVSALAAHEGGFVACGSFTGSVTLGGEAITADANGDLLLVVGDAHGDVLRTIRIAGSATADCRGISTDGGRAMAVGSYLDGTLAADRFMLPEPASSDAWTVVFDIEGEVKFAREGGGRSADVGSAALLSSSGAFMAAGTMGDATFGEVTSPDTPALALVRFDETGNAEASFAPATDADGDEPSTTPSAIAATPSGAPIVAVGLSSGLTRSHFIFGPMRIESTRTFGTEGFVVGYSVDGTQARWVAPVSGPPTREVVVAAVGTREIVVAGVFEERVTIADGVEIDASGRQQDGSLVRYRVR